MAVNTPSSLICFKNGYSYVNIPVTLKSDGKNVKDTNIRECQVGPLPDLVVHGTVTLEPHNPEKVQIISLSRAAEKTIEPDSLKISNDENDYSYEKILEENIGAAVRLTCVTKADTGQTGIGQIVCGEKTFDGIIKAVHKDAADKGRSSVVLKSLDENRGEKLIRCDSIAFVETSQIMDKYVKGLDSDEKEGGNGIGNHNRLSVRYAVSSADSDEIIGANLSYLTRGLMWAPSYMLRQDRKSKTMALQGNACLLCDLPFFKGNSVDSVALVSGHPKIECRNIGDPLASGVTAAEFSNGLDLLLGTLMVGDQLKRQQVQPLGKMAAGYNGGGISPPNSSGTLNSEFGFTEGMSGDQHMDDSYFYKLKNVPLHCNRPMSLPFIHKWGPRPYQDVYFFDLNGKEGGGNDGSMMDAIHAITFKNNSGQPLTAGPVSILADERGNDGDDIEVNKPTTNPKENRFLVQGLMKFTGPNKTATVELTKALDVEGNFIIETSGEREVEERIKNKNDEYELECIHKTATLTIKNMKNEGVKCKIDRFLYGHFGISDPHFTEETERQVGHQELNPAAKYVWNIEVPANGKAKLVFTYCIKAWIMKAKLDQKSANELQTGYRVQERPSTRSPGSRWRSALVVISRKDTRKNNRKK